MAGKTGSSRGGGGVVYVGGKWDGTAYAGERESHFSRKLRCRIPNKSRDSKVPHRPFVSFRVV